MSLKSNLRLLVIFSVAFSLATLSGPLSSHFHLPTIQPAMAIPQLCQTHGIGGACSEYWYPAGPEENTLVDQIFTDESAEFSDLQSTLPSIDFTDTPLPSTSVPFYITQPNFVVTGPISQAGYFEIQFMLANDFWGCNFNFGNSTCGVDVRQGIWHMIDTASFAANGPSLTGQAVALDSPNPSDNQGGLPSANPCNWDSMFPETGSACVVGAPGGTAYHLDNATGAGGYAWNQAPGSRDMDAAAAHFVTAGIATGCDGGTGVASCLASMDSILSGVSSAAANHPVNFFIRNDNPPRLDLGNSLAEQICYLFTGSYSVPCGYLTVTRGPITAFPGFTPSTTSVNDNWGMYTALYASTFGALPFDSSFYFTYNSQFVSGIPSIKSPNGPCSAGSFPDVSAPDYMYLCDPVYDSVSGQIETAPCLNSLGDPTLGSVSNGPGGHCPGTAQLSAVSAGLLAEDRFGKNAYTIGVFEQTAQFGYTNTGWTRVINDNGAGLPNFFTWLNAWNPAPPVSGTIRQGFRQTTSSVSPFVSSTFWDSYMVNNVYDSLYRPNPLNTAQLIPWMTVDFQQLANNQLTYAPPPPTIQTFRLTLRPDVFFQDGSPVTAYDAAFSILNTINTFAGAGTISVAGVTVLGLHQFDINLATLGAFTPSSLLTVPIMPGEFWNNVGPSTWNHAVSICGSTDSCFPAQYTFNFPILGFISCTLSCDRFPGSLMGVNVADTSASFDPIAHHIFIGSGPWQCGTGSGLGGPGCSSSGAQNPPVGGRYTLTRFGNGLAPGSSVTGTYFRSSGNLALWIWSQDNGDITHDFLNFAIVADCFGAPVTSTGPCAHFQQGIGANGGPGPVGLSQVAIVNRFNGVNWVAPYGWTTAPPTGIAPFPPTLYEGTTVLSPANVVGCPAGYDC